MKNSIVCWKGLFLFAVAAWNFADAFSTTQNAKVPLRVIPPGSMVAYPRPVKFASSTLSSSLFSSSSSSDDDSFMMMTKSPRTSKGQQHQSQQKQQKQQRSLMDYLPSTSTTVMALASAATAATIFPMASHAALTDVASLSVGGAAAANSWLTGFGETGFYQAFTLVFLSEIGDKTFFIAGLLAMKTSRLISFVGSISALAVMTVISVIIGQVFHAVPSGIADGIPLDDVAAVLAFAFFGIKTLQEALAMDGEGESTMDEELAEAEEAVEDNDISKQATLFARILSIFGLVFAAEFGDRSFLSTIALSAAQNPVSVAVGATAAHAVATGIAVAGGAVLAKYISERVIGIISGTLFLVFAATTAFGIF